MPNPFSSKYNKPQPAPEPTNQGGEVVGGVFDCQHCDEKVREARLLDNGDLVWRCTEGHVSRIKEFM